MCGGGGVHSCGYVLITMLVVALLFGLIALGIPYWYVSDATYSTGSAGGMVKTVIREGLWKKCTDLEYTSDSSSFCVDNDATSAIKGMRWTLMVSSGILGIAALAGGAAHMEKNRTAFVVTAVHAVIAALCKFAVSAIYATLIKDDLSFETKHLHAGWALAVLGGLLSLMSAFTAFVLARCVAPSKVGDSSSDLGNSNKDKAKVGKGMDDPEVGNSKNKNKTDDKKKEETKGKGKGKADVKQNETDNSKSKANAKEKKKEKTSSQIDVKVAANSDWD